MTTNLMMPCSVLIGRGVAAERGAAGLAGAQMYPGTAGFNACIAHVPAGGQHVSNSAEVTAPVVLTGHNRACFKKSYLNKSILNPHTNES